ncbi:serine--tRNA synthetase-like protein Slimp [Armigeres subalbatus]|uniref:serine--tRNA synthetase-like protein Slimp n=1 Tax=Armigeres subalbatus TaxID=124917 RepID=UPI002ED1B4BE
MLRTRKLFSYLSRRSLSSALYITGDKAKEQYAPLVPYLDFQAKLSDLEKLQHNLKLRRYQLDFEALKQQWDLYRSIELRKREIEVRRVQLRDEINKSKNEDEIKQLKMQATLAKDDLKTLKESGYAVADKFVAGTFLSIPNELHERTPDGQEVVLYEQGSSKEASPIGEKWLEKYDSTCFYMTEDAALMDLFIPMNCAGVLQDAGYVLFSNPDFVRSVLVEAAREDPHSIYQINEEVGLDHKLNLLHLCGGGSMLSFLGYLTKLSVFPSALPLRLVAIGKQYFYNKTQTSAVQMLGAARESLEAVQIFDETIELYKRFYDQLELRYRMVQVPAHQLEASEAMRVDVELYSPRSEGFVKVGNICYYADFISKRIAFNYHEGKAQKFPHLVSGTVLRANDLIEVLLQHGVRYEDLKFLKR